jgi:hypothetical protein
MEVHGSRVGEIMIIVPFAVAPGTSLLGGVVLRLAWASSSAST